jgi:hypothetical protein
MREGPGSRNPIKGGVKAGRVVGNPPAAHAHHLASGAPCAAGLRLQMLARTDKGSALGWSYQQE